MKTSVMKFAVALALVSAFALSAATVSLSGATAAKACTEQYGVPPPMTPRIVEAQAAT
jgi:hypothetical protein